MGRGAGYPGDEVRVIGDEVPAVTCVTMCESDVALRV